MLRAQAISAPKNPTSVRLIAYINQLGRHSGIDAVRSLPILLTKCGLERANLAPKPLKALRSFPPFFPGFC
jgi:hypothetical protein